MAKRKAKTKGVKYWKKKAWDKFSRFIRFRDAIATTHTKEFVICCSCGKIYPAFGIGCVQAGHFVPGRSHSLLFRERGTHGQCYNCNVNLKSNWVEYEKFMLKKYGEEVVQQEKDAKNSGLKYRAFELEELFNYYSTKAKELEKWDGNLK